MPTMEELANQYQQQQQPVVPPQETPVAPPSMEDLVSQYKNQSIGNIPEGQNVLPSPVNEDMSGATGFEMNKGTWKQIPSFMKKVDMINTGVDRGVKTFTLALMSKLPFGDKWQNAIKQVDAQSTAEQQHNKDTYEGYYPQIGEAGGEMLTTLPAGGVLGKVASKALALGKGGAILPSVANAAKKIPIVGDALSTPFASSLPTGLKTLGKYGYSAGAGAGVLAGMESQKYDPNNPGQLINQEAAGQALSNPLSYAIPALGTKVSTWMGASRDLAAAKEVFPGIMSRNLKEPGAATTASNMFFGIPAALLDMGKQANQFNGIGKDVVAPFIQKLAGTTGAQTADNLTSYSANIIQSTLKKMNRAEDKIWEQGFKTVPIADPQAVKDEVVNAIDLLNTRKPSGYETSVGDLTDALKTGAMKVDDVKQLQSIVSSASISAGGLKGGVGIKLSSQLQDIKDNLLNHIQNSLSPEDMSAFSAAREFSGNKFELFKQAPLLQKAVIDVASAHKLVNTLTSEGGVIPPKTAAMSILSPGGQDMVAATKLQQALEAADPAKTGKLNLDTFLKKTSDYTQNKMIMNKNAYNNLQGLNVYLKNVNDASKTGWWRQAAIIGTAATALGIGAGPAAVSLAAPALISYMAANVVANHSPLKYIMNGLVNLSAKGIKAAGGSTNSSSIYNHLIKAVDKHLTRAGLIMSQDGVLQHKDEPQDNQGAQ